MNRIALFTFLIFPFSVAAMDGLTKETTAKAERYKAFCALQEIFDAVDYTIVKNKGTSHSMSSARAEDPNPFFRHTKEGFLIEGLLCLDDQTDDKYKTVLPFFSRIIHPWGFSELRKGELLQSGLGSKLSNARGIFQEKVTLHCLGKKPNSFGLPATMYKVVAVSDQPMPEPVPVVRESMEQADALTKEWRELKARYEQEHGKK